MNIRGMVIAAGVAACMGPAIAHGQTDLGQTDIEQVWARARAVSPQPLSLDREHAEWLEERKTDESADRVWDGRWTFSATRDAAARRLVVSEDRLAMACVDFDLHDCVVQQAGSLMARDGQLYWQIQYGEEPNGTTQGFILLTPTAQGLKPVAWSFDGLVYSPPILIHDEDGRAYVAIPGRKAGTGKYNADRLYRWTPTAAVPLTQIDNESWRDGLDARLPAGLHVQKGVDFSYENLGNVVNLSAQTLLWRDDDGNCCAAGGDAWLTFDIENDALVLTDVQVQDAFASIAATVPTDIYDYAGRWMGCSHWGGEEPYDANRRAEIEAAVTELRCSALQGDGEALKAKYRHRQALLERIQSLGE